MLKRLYLFVTILLIVILLAPGCAVKKMTKQAQQFEGAAMFKEASEMYYQALLKKPSKAELKIGLKRTGQIYYEELSTELKNSFSRGDYKQTVYHYMEANEMINKYKRTGVSIKPDPSLERYFSDAKSHYLDERYTLGLKHITDQDFEDAKVVFGEISNIDPDFRDTRSYLNEATFEPIYREGNQYYNDGRFMDAYNTWDNIFTNEKNYKDTRERMDQALNERYKEGSLFLMDENFNEAALALGEVYRANPNFKDVKIQYIEARSEPVYRQANTEMNQGKCRTAYFNFEHILDDAGSYKNSKSLKNKALKCAAYPIAVYSRPVKHYTADAVLFENSTIKNLVNKNNIFLKVFDLTNINGRLENRLIKSSGDIDEASLNTLNRENDIKAVLILEYDKYEKTKGQLKKDEMTGFERIVTKSTDGETSLYDKRIVYYEYSQKNKISVSVRYKLVSTITGEVLVSDNYSGTEKDEINYATYGGDKNQLYPAKNNRGSWNIDESGYRSLQTLLRRETQIESIENLQQILFNEISDDIASDINNFNPEK